MEKTKPMSLMALHEEKQQLLNVILHIIADLEELTTDKIELLQIIPVLKGLKVVYKTAKVFNQKYARTIKYSELANWG